MFLAEIPAERIAYIHIAGHERRREDLCVDTHAQTVCEPVWDLLMQTYQNVGVLPTLLERDDQFDHFDGLLDEVDRIRVIQQAASSQQVVNA